jgi:hypothetical protein
MKAWQASWRITIVVVLLALNGFVLYIPPARAEETPITYYAYLPIMGSNLWARSIPQVGVHIEENSVFAYRSNLSNALYLVGEVYNNTNQNVGDVFLSARVYNAQGQLLAAQGAGIYLPVLVQGAKTCFAIIFPNDDGRLNTWARYEFDLPAYNWSLEQPHQLTISGLYGRLDAATKEYIVSGSVINNETTQVRCVQTVGTLYNTEGKVTGCAAAYVSSVHISAGASSSFEIKFYGRSYSDYSGFTIQADGTP